MAPWIQISDDILTKDEAKMLIKKLDKFLDQKLGINPPRTGEEIRLERVTRNRERDPKLVAAARLRDGDNCRWCGVLVFWSGPRSARSGGYIHRTEEIEVDLLVACRACASASDGALPMPAPLNPLYGERTKSFLFGTRKVASLPVVGVRSVPEADDASGVEGSDEVIHIRVRFLRAYEVERSLDSEVAFGSHTEGSDQIVGFDLEVDSGARPLPNQISELVQNIVIDVLKREVPVVELSHESSLSLGGSTDPVDGCGDLSLEEEDKLPKDGRYCPNCGSCPDSLSTVNDSLTREVFLVCPTCAQDRNGLGLPLLPMKETPPQPEFVLRNLSFCSHCGNKLGSTAMDIRVWHSHVSWIMCTPCFEERLAA